jgi:3-hydroxyisobutyrate dehydrogenase-like beta-hydroxyacid dehydrogenase
VEFLEAPISGRPADVAGGRATVIVGGDESVAANAAGTLEALGRVLTVGPVGSASVMKLAVNLVVFTHVVGIAESLALAESAGIAPDTAYDVLSASAVASDFIRVRRSLYLDSTAPVQFPMGAGVGVSSAILDAASAAGLDLPVIAAAAAAFRTAASTDGSRDVTRIVDDLRRPANGPRAATG